MDSLVDSSAGSLDISVLLAPVPGWPSVYSHADQF